MTQEQRDELETYSDEFDVEDMSDALYGCPPDELSESQAAEFITALAGYDAMVSGWEGPARP